MFRRNLATRLSCAAIAVVAGLLSGLPGAAGLAAPAADPLTIEAEQATLTGGAAVETEHAGYSGTGYVGRLTDAHKGAAAVTFAVTATGSRTLDLRYANGTGSTMTLSLYLGTQRLRQLPLPATGSWSTWSSATTTVQLPAGTSNVGYRFDQTDSGNVNLDRLTVAAPPPAEPGVLEAEAATLAGGAAVETEHPGYSGTGYVGQLTDAHKGTAAVTFAVTAAGAGSHTLDLRYANGTGATMTLSLYLGSTRLRQLALPASGSWDTWTTASTTVDLPGGTSDVGYRYDQTDTGNVNLDRLAVTAVPGAEPCAVQAPSVCFEAEDGFLAGGAVRATSTAGFSGGGYATGLASATARLVVPVGVASGQSQTLTVRYAGSTGQSVTLTGNGVPLVQLALPASGGWAEVTRSVTLPAGLGSIGLSGGGDVAIDRIVLSRGSAPAARGATVPYTEYEAESASTNGTAFGPDRTYRTVSSEASGRRGVRLDATGEYVEFQLTQPTNSLVVRYSIPDSADGAGTTAPIAVYAGGVKLQDLQLTSAYSWVYGDYPFPNDPSLGRAHRFFNETRTLLDPLPAGTTLRLRKDASSNAGYYDIDLVDTESVGAPLAAPQGYVDITQHGATPGDSGDDTAAIRAAIAAARAAGAGVWVPSGTFVITDRLEVQGVAVRGAGPWYSVLKGRDGRGGFLATGSDVTLADLMIDGDVRYRDPDGVVTTDTAIEGNFGTGSLVQNVWVEHTKTGLWLTAGTDGLLALGMRIRDTFADGVNMRGNVRDTRVEHSVLRNTGDDALAMWSDGAPVTRSGYAFNTVQTPMLGNGIGIYGGDSNLAEDNLVSDTVTASAGIAVGTRFNPVPLSGETSVQRNTLVRTGGHEPNWDSQFGALWIYADTADITAPVTVRDMDIRDSTYQGILISWQRRVENLTFERVTVDGAGTYGIEINATGSATFSYTTVTDATSGGLNASAGFTVVRGPGNSGF
ncbi:MAG: carbohydrate-binding protein [Actinophytocola sp.]|uniref:carbohydrate-binding protein n=1 Tax=Actinophytocola sp. TaxID=1872138 RepID=UPI001326ED9F|nr:carbohydrate-binding protein [Actinophytocola sp.]MPZ85603.1 carbohydrate-binding protein [Actinophytocola sp.]